MYKAKWKGAKSRPVEGERYRNNVKPIQTRSAKTRANFSTSTADENDDVPELVNLDTRVNIMTDSVNQMDKSSSTLDDTSNSLTTDAHELSQLNAPEKSVSIHCDGCNFTF